MAPTFRSMPLQPLTPSPPRVRRWGLMVGSVFDLILQDLEREGWADDVARLKRDTEVRSRKRK
jgi:hypothetical protein